MKRGEFLDGRGSVRVMGSRRDFMLGLGAFSLHQHALAAGKASPQLVRESQRGDVLLRYESIDIDRRLMDDLVAPGRASYEARAGDFPGLVLRTARLFVGQSRSTDRDSIARMLELFELPFQDSSGHYIPFCAAGLSYIVALAYLGYWSKEVNLTTLTGALADIDHHHFFPSPSVWDIYNVANAKHRWTDRLRSPIPKRGWLVVYDFGRGADHVGLVTGADRTGMSTFECNTSGSAPGTERNGGVITTKVRPWRLYARYVKGFVRTDLVTTL